MGHDIRLYEFVYLSRKYLRSCLPGPFVHHLYDSSHIYLAILSYIYIQNSVEQQQQQQQQQTAHVKTDFNMKLSTRESVIIGLF